MNAEDLKQRTKKFALEIIKMSEQLSKHRASDIIAKQIIRSATSVGANYRAACCARSKADFISKVGIVQEESDETIYWLELIQSVGLINPENLKDLLKESKELTAIFSAAVRTAKMKNCAQNN